MKQRIYNLYQAKSALSSLVDRAASGEEIVIAKNGKPLAKLVAVGRPIRPRIPGGWEGRVRIAEDFDMPLPADILDAFEGRS
jgi:prevent-host-death family protein